MPKFQITVVETVAYTKEIMAHDEEAARMRVHQEIREQGVASLDFSGVVERSIDVEEVQ